ncbi:MAG: DUF488 domain-containing protein [Patescibacteria group bacterium]
MSSPESLRPSPETAEQPRLKTKSILSPREAADGTRICVMSRLTLNDGVTPDPCLEKADFDEWIKDVAPPAKLVGDYYKRGLPWETFEQRYRAFLETPQARATVEALARRSRTETITLLCIEETDTHCHRRLLAEAISAAVARMVRD